MKLQVMAVYDSAARAYLVPFFVSRVEVGQRSFADAAYDKNQQIGRNPEDFTLWHLGEWDDEKASFTLHEPARNLGHATQYLKGESSVSKVA